MIFTLLCIKEFVKNFPFVNKNNPIEKDTTTKTPIEGKEKDTEESPKEGLEKNT